MRKPVELKRPKTPSFQKVLYLMTIKRRKVANLQFWKMMTSHVNKELVEWAEAKRG